MYRMLAATAEFQRDLIIANTREGLVAARARGQPASKSTVSAGPARADDHHNSTPRSTRRLIHA
jgi:DNA invertase Pin-like site-specific DNA recombinase